MKNQKDTKLYNRKKTYYKKDKFFIVLIVLIILLIINLVFLFLNNKEKQELRKKELEKEALIIKKEKERKSIKKGDIIFLGDSLTDMYNLDKYYRFPIVNSGVSGWTTDDILNHLDEKVFKYKPKQLILLIGTNDLNHGKDISYIVNNIKKIVEKIKEKEPQVKIYLESLYPINNTDDKKVSHYSVGIRTNEDIIKINKKLKKYTEKENLVYINMYDKLTDEDGNLKIEYTREGLHMSDEGYKVITVEYLKTLDL